MTTLRKIVVLVFLGVFVAAFVLAALGGTKKVEMADGALMGFFAVLIGQCLTAIVAAFRTPDFFREDTKSIAQVEQRYTEAIAHQQALHLDEVAKLEAAHRVDLDESAIEILKWKRKALDLGPQQVPRDDFGKPLR